MPEHTINYYGQCKLPVNCSLAHGSKCKTLCGPIDSNKQHIDTKPSEQHGSCTTTEKVPSIDIKK